jgi:hypothetical protein
MVEANMRAKSVGIWIIPKLIEEGPEAFDNSPEGRILFHRLDRCPGL